ncbi:serine protease [uncultured Chitinophaga sp.]|jgi:hypothetical protein|uniref:trypsin-like serine peptidase n=1 Tax=uncultured Chitinophaga sp. TaxID=339340 RepID=UPI00261927D7|nr:serine protease [uncultured Chitinophaga sp.]
MDWNNTLTELNYYLARLFAHDITNKEKASLVEKAGMPVYMIEIPQQQLLAWFNILQFAAARNQVVRLLEVITAPEMGNAGDEFLKGAIVAMQSGKAIRNISLPDDEWKGGNDIAATKEKILGKKSTLLPIGFLEQGTDAARAVVRIVTENELGTGFLLAQRWLLTNNHVLPNLETAAAASIEFNYQFPKGIKVSTKQPADLKAEYATRLTPGTADKPLFYTNEAEDWTLVKIDDPQIDPFGFFTMAAPGLKPGDFVNIIQHPLGGPKQIGIYQNMVMYADDAIVQYMTDTNTGSSGSPVVNSDWEVVAIHHSGGWVEDPATKETVRRNQGTNIQRVKAFIDQLNHHK